MAVSAILPRRQDDPTGQDRRERGAMLEFKRRLRQVLKVYTDALARIPFEEVEELAVNASYYTFQLSGSQLSNLYTLTGEVVDAILLEGGESQLWFSLDYIVPAYQQGTNQTMANLTAQSRAYAVTRPTLQTLLLSEPYQRRLGLLLAREFEEVKGLTATVKKNMGFILGQGLATGNGPREIAKALAAQLDIELSRANRLARTEVNNALRTARLDEADQAAAELGLFIRQMHLSALSPTTRPTHASRHGSVFTMQAQRVWWASDANSINCKCSTTEIITGPNGVPLNPAFVAKVRAQGVRYRESLED